MDKTTIETYDNDIDLQCLNREALQRLCRAAGLSDRGGDKQLVARLRKWYQS